MSLCAELKVIEAFYDAETSERIYQRLLHEQSWPDNRYTHAGRQFVLPRLQTWHADSGIRYSYSNNLLETRPWTPLLSDIRAKIEASLNLSFNSVLVNCYRNGEDHVGWHADNEPELGELPFIASLTLGVERPFAYRHKKTSENGSILLRSGTLLIMQPDFQRHWLHSVPVDKNTTHGRINLTFRKVVAINNH
ncbi:alpha-ketoglutarate-dependent dioxygenase AlkB [Candidatus Methylospira mobilis]|uniref:Alpha-ketoglutarate-dependent dioxygenase AlkB n=1 Tax=Candidatus Methylospira mobilis TaxID=1808979 RepID=A0A5Q0BMG1_9GAMM|nr:alpha-ketoglutarate-dependent dioxygenase AlkB [Candidatus Methylospira mobilis]QFY43414.1 alpha-ketoglutarate-dependent dioxygenase AlkB [Candidatus Methylospira mobilis]WNV03348.1 alpha-ketoglutarate-dependent dioxygenase AlkB [Candidatus Methylospira mobilis]